MQKQHNYKQKRKNAINIFLNKIIIKMQNNIESHQLSINLTIILSRYDLIIN